MKYQDALKFFAEHGGVCESDPEILGESRPSEGQLFQAVYVAVNHFGQSQEDANAARRAIVDHWGKYNHMRESHD